MVAGIALIFEIYIYWSCICVLMALHVLFNVIISPSNRIWHMASNYLVPSHSLADNYTLSSLKM